MKISSINEKRNNGIDGSGLENYLAHGVEQVVKGILKASLRNPAAAAFMMKYRKSCEEAAEKRARSAESGKHIPPFLIASITTSCNLHCKGCYARANNSCFDEAQAGSASGIESASASAAGSGSPGGSLPAASCSNAAGARPFSPYSDTTLLDVSLEEALRSPLFTKLRTGGMLTEDHAGGCVLFGQEDAVMALRDRCGDAKVMRGPSVDGAMTGSIEAADIDKEAAV